MAAGTADDVRARWRQYAAAIEAVRRLVASVRPSRPEVRYFLQELSNARGAVRGAMEDERALAGFWQTSDPFAVGRLAAAHLSFSPVQLGDFTEALSAGSQALEAAREAKRRHLAAATI